MLKWRTISWFLKNFVWVFNSSAATADVCSAHVDPDTILSPFCVSFMALPTHTQEKDIKCGAQMFPNHYLHPLLRGWVDSSCTHTHTHHRQQAWERKNYRLCRVCMWENKRGRGRDTVTNHVTLFIMKKLHISCLLDAFENINACCRPLQMFSVCALTLRSLSPLL